jgi:hypothetical protein
MQYRGDCPAWRWAIRAETSFSATKLVCLPLARDRHPAGPGVYQNGVRVNEVFGDIVNWDFIPETAINRMTLMPSIPVYGLNALGGALSIEMKNGFTYQGADAELRGGSFGRRAAMVQAGGQAGNLSGYLTPDAINENGWRDYSPSPLRRIYADLGARGDKTEFHVTFTGASNNFSAAAQPDRAAPTGIGRSIRSQTTQISWPFLLRAPTGIRSTLFRSRAMPTTEDSGSVVWTATGPGMS